MVKPHAKTATALAPRTIENGIMRGAGRAALERAPSFSELNVPVFCTKFLLHVRGNIQFLTDLFHMFPSSSTPRKHLFSLIFYFFFWKYRGREFR
jgi:hypothetical protein